MSKKLDMGDRHLLELAVQGEDAEGWAKVSERVWPAVANLPSELIEKEKLETGGRVRLTEAGRTVLAWT